MRECPHCGALADDADVVCRYCAGNLDGTGGPGGAYRSGPTEERGTPPREEPQNKRAQNPRGEPKQQSRSNFRRPRDYQAPPPPRSGEYRGGYRQGPYEPPPQDDPYRRKSGPYDPGGQNEYASGSREAYDMPPYGYPVYQRDINRIVAGVLAIVLGTFGVHKFYMGKTGLGILYICLMWTGFPTIAGLVEGIMYLCQDDYAFREKYCRLTK